MHFCALRCVSTIVGLAVLIGMTGFPARAQGQGGFGLPGGGGTAAQAISGQQQNSAQQATPPSLQNQGPTPGATNQSLPGGATRGGKLPQAAGQEHRVYDLRPYTGYMNGIENPEQAVVDWVLRETGTDIWFTSPFGFLSADRDQLSVYHTREMHHVVAGIVDRFVAGDKEPQVLSIRVMRVGNPNWRSQAHMLMQHVSVDSPGVQAWLLSKENAALVLNQLRQRTDAQQTQALDLVTLNGQTQRLTKTNGRNYVRNIRQARTGWPPYEPETGQIMEGYDIEISPLLSVDGKSVDCVINAKIDQVDKLVPVELDLPLPNAEVHRTKIDVPQVVSWRLHERFRWPSDMVLLLSCGVVASPERQQSSIPFLNMDAITGTTSGRADALMFLAFQGRATDNMPTSPSIPQISTGAGSANRGRY